jgi:hypothetical protein
MELMLDAPRKFWVDVNNRHNMGDPKAGDFISVTSSVKI